MKRLLYILIISFAMGMVLLGITSCTDDEAVVGSVTDNELTIHLSFAKNKSGGISTRALGNDDEPGNKAFNEEKIERLDIFFFQGGKLKWKVTNDKLNYNSTTNFATIPIPTDKMPLFKDAANSTYDVYVVANNTANLSSISDVVGSESTLQQLKNVVFETPELATNGGKEPLANFVMDGSITNKEISLKNYGLGTVDLNRAASKIRMRVVEVNVPGYKLCTNKNITARLMHLTTKSTLMDGGDVSGSRTDSWYNTDEAAMPVTNQGDLGEKGITTVAPFYAYQNNWQKDKARETYIELNVPLIIENEDDTYSESESVYYKYRIRLTPNLTGDDANKYMNRLNRNTLYDIAVRVRILGGVAEIPVDIEDSNYTILDWGKKDVLVEFEGVNYLVVSERNVVMTNTDNYTLTFNSSIPDVKLVEGSLKASYTYVPAGASNPTTKEVTDDQMLSVIVDSTTVSGTIKITSSIPTNYIPKDITFKITNGPLTETVIVEQLPATYFTTTKGVRSSRYNQLPSHLTNPYMYAITSLAPDGDMIIGFPPVDSQNQTINSEEVSKMVSPKFEMASQFGASSTQGYSAAQTQCRNYWEDAEDGTRKYGWRLPTAAEIYYIDNLQQVAPSGAVMTGLYYWSSWSQYPNSSRDRGAYRMGVNLYNTQTYFGYSSGNSTIAYTRCIRDIKN